MENCFYSGVNCTLLLLYANTHHRSTTSLSYLNLRRRFLCASTPSSLTSEFQEGEPGRPFFFSFSAVNGFHMASSESCREVIRQHSITGGQSVCLFAHVTAAFQPLGCSSRGGFHEEGGSALKYHHLARLPSLVNRVSEQRIREDPDVMCGQIHLLLLN